MHPSKAKGNRAELQVQAMLRDNLGVPARRALGAGRLDDIGDVVGVPDTVIQVADRRDLQRTIKLKPLEAERQRQNAKAQFAATFIKLFGGEWRVVMTPEQFFALWREAQ
jgi:hypothetical protein